MKVFGSNIAALGAVRMVHSHSAALATSTERLSSGLRINSARDDPAGHAVAMELATESRLLERAARNISDGISAIQIADSALGELASITHRVKELAEQAANGIYSQAQRNALDMEADALVVEYNRIIETVEFNGVNLFSHSGSTTFQIDTGEYATLSTSWNSRLYGAIGAGTLKAPAYDGNFIISEDTTPDLNRDGIEDRVQIGGASSYVRLGNGDGTYRIGAVLTHTYNSADETFADFDSDGILDIAIYHYQGGGNGVVNLYFGVGNGTFTAGATRVIGTPEFSVIAAGDLNGDGVPDIQVDSAADGIFQLHSNTTQSVVMKGVDLTTQGGALGALAESEAQAERVLLQRAALGATMSRLDSALAAAQSRRVEFEKAASRITNLDVAEEIVAYTNRQVLLQAATAVLAQANQLPSVALSLLTG